MHSQSRFGRIDFWLLVTVLVLLVFSIVMITSIGVTKSITLTKPPSVQYPSCGEDGVDCFFLLRRHVLRIGIGLLAMVIFYRIPLRVWKKSAVALFLLIFLALIILLIAGSTANTTARAWFIYYGNSFQPAEAAKLILIFYLSAWMERKGRDISDFRNGFLSFCIVTGLIVLPVLLQPDFGSALLYASIATAVYFAAGARIRHLALGLLAVFLFMILVVPNVQYLRHRFTAFVNPSVENCEPVARTGESRKNYCWQTQQAKIAVGSGGIFGKGLAQGIQKSYWLPQATDDFIFAASAEELGFIRILFVIICYIVIAYRGFMIAHYTSDRFTMLIATGITTWLVVQAFINIGVNIGLMPVTGITLPFVSYGGTSMLVTLSAVGVLLQISKTSTLYAPRHDRRRDRGARVPQYRRY